MIRIPDGWRYAALALLIAACGGESRTAPHELKQDFPANVSDPLPAANAPSGAASFSATPVAYVSLDPGTTPGALSASIRNERTGTVMVVPIVAGGFDPVPVPAEAGDIIEITVVSGTVTLVTAIPVPIHRHPTVVRTDPPPHKRDVPLNASIMVVFSEPIDPRSLSSSSVQLQSGGHTIGGTLGLIPGTASTAVFTPAAPLAAGATYELSVFQGITDLTGDALESTIQVSFTTVSDDATPQFTGRVAFVSNRDGADAIYVTNADRPGITRLTTGTTPVWSPDGQRIAFVRGEQIFVVNVDGSGVQSLAAGLNPAWSPDGSQIVFSGPTSVSTWGIFVMNADGSGIHELLDPEFAADGLTGSLVAKPAWSPDGRSIAFERFNSDVPSTIYIMNADGTAPRLLNMAATVGDSRFTWSPDGTRLLLQVGHPLQWMITSFDLNGGGGAPYAQGTYVGNPDWSPDGGSILFESFSGPPDQSSPFGTQLRIYLLNLIGHEQVRQLIPEAVSPVISNYSDHQAAWLRGSPWDY